MRVFDDASVQPSRAALGKTRRAGDRVAADAGYCRAESDALRHAVVGRSTA